MPENFSIQPYLNDLDILNQTAEQIKKDFSFFDLPIVFTGHKNSAYEELSSQIQPHIKKLMDENYEKFLSLLYRIDLNEKLIDFSIIKHETRNDQTAEHYFTDLIIKRCLQKVILRKYFSK